MTEKVQTCRLGTILASVQGKEAELLQGAVADREKWSAYRLAFQLKKAQHSVGATTIKIHRRQECGCYLNDN